MFYNQKPGLGTWSDHFTLNCKKKKKKKGTQACDV